MGNKPVVDVETFVANVNKKSKHHNGKKTRFGWSKRKRKN